MKDNGDRRTINRPAEAEGRSDLPTVAIYTDGGCNPNPGPGAWAAILLYPGQSPRELVGTEAETTNNRMELRAALEGLAALPVPHRVTIYTDSRYLREGITKWLPSWQERGWQTTAKDEVRNQDLWRALAAEVSRHRVTWHWTRGHAGNRWNERADELVRQALAGPTLPLDDEQAVHIFLATSYLAKAKRGGWAALLRFRGHEKTLTGTESDSSANRLQIQAALEGLRAITRQVPVHIYTSSDYLRSGASLWLGAWRARNWHTREGQPVRHHDLWRQLADLLEQRKVSWHLVVGPNQPAEMARAKQLAEQAARGAPASSEKGEGKA